MPADHKEIAFEAAIEESLLTHGGFLKGDPEAFDRNLALDRGDLFAFLRASQQSSPRGTPKLRRSTARTRSSFREASMVTENEELALAGDLLADPSRGWSERRN